jgi:hypothetical protein
MAVAFAVGLAKPQPGDTSDIMKPGSCYEAILLGLRFLAIPLTYIIVGLTVLLPASITLTRIEAACLPEGEEAVVHFDKEAILGGVDLAVGGGCCALFVHTWRSVDRASRWRVIKLYTKLIVTQVTVACVGISFMGGELYLIGSERISIFSKSVAAQLQLMAIEARKQQ